MPTLKLVNLQFTITSLYKFLEPVAQSVKIFTAPHRFLATLYYIMTFKQSKSVLFTDPLNEGRFVTFP